MALSSLSAVTRDSYTMGCTRDFKELSFTLPPFDHRNFNILIEFGFSKIDLQYAAPSELDVKAIKVSAWYIK